MTIRVQCENPACQKPLQVKDELAGKRIKCPSCGGTFRCVAEAETARGSPLPPPTRVAVWPWLLPGWIVVPILPLIAVSSGNPLYIGFGTFLSLMIFVRLLTLARRVAFGGHPVLSALASRHVRFIVAVSVIMFTSTAVIGFAVIWLTVGFKISPVWAFLIFLALGVLLGLMLGAVMAAMAPFGRTYWLVPCPSCGFASVRGQRSEFLQWCDECDAVCCSRCNEKAQCPACRRGSVHAVERLGL